MTSSADSDPDNDLRRLADATEDMRKLLIFALMKSGVSQAQIASALGVNQSSISRLFQREKNAPRSHK